MLVSMEQQEYTMVKLPFLVKSQKLVKLFNTWLTKNKNILKNLMS